MKKLLSMLGAIGLVATSSAAVVSCGDKDEVFDFGKMTAMEPKLELIGDANAKTSPTPKAILDAFNAEKNLKLTLADDVDITNIKAQSGASLNAGAPKTAPSVNFSCKITAKAESKKVTGVGGLLIKVSAMDLAKITGDNTKLATTGDVAVAPTPEAILKLFNDKNNLKLTATDVTIVTATTGVYAANGGTPKTADFTATISAVETSTIAFGEVKVTITIKPFDLGTAVTDLKAKVGDEINDDEIIAAFNEANKTKIIKNTDVTVEINDDKNGATITAVETSTLVESSAIVTIKFDLSTVTQTTLAITVDDITKAPGKDVVLDSFIGATHLSALTLDDIEIDDLTTIAGTINAKSTSKLVTGKILVNIVLVQNK